MGQIQSYPAITNANLTTSDQLLVNDASGPNTTKNITFNELDKRWFGTTGNFTFSGTLTGGNVIANLAGSTGITGATGGITNEDSTTIIADNLADGTGVVDLQTRNISRFQVLNGGDIYVVNAFGIGTNNVDAGVLQQIQSAGANAALRIKTDLTGSSDIFGSLQYGNGTDAQLCAIRGIADGFNDSGYLAFFTEATGANLEEAARINSKKNFALNTTTFDGSVSGYLTIGNGTEPSAVTADQIYVGAKNATGTSLSTLAMYSEEVPSAGAPTLSHKVKVWWNGTEYWLGLDAV